ncbi:MAG: hypothetical protein JO250_23810 [Armatimonadetes bacterium]|nr:hypothetical protein [Armatimonadota bacterium]
MTVGEPSVVKVLVSKDCKAELTQKFKDEGLGIPKVVKVRVSQFMTVHLRGDAGAFDVQSPDPKQLIAEDQGTQWNFTVTPKEEGVHVLTLTADVILKANNKEVTHEYPVFEKKVDVKVRFGERIKRMTVAGLQVAGGATGLAALLTAVVAMINTRKKDEKPADKEKEGPKPKAPHTGRRGRRQKDRQGRFRH